jgi:short-subunit dehydrogenase
MESTFAGKTVLVTGANRGLGPALVDGAVVNFLSTAAAAALPIIPSYSISKAAR